MAISDGDRHEAYLRRVQKPVLDVENVLAVLRRRAVFIAGVTLACAALSLVYILMASPKYVASGRILLDGSGLDDQVTILASRGVFDKVIEQHKLENDPLFGARPAGVLRTLMVRVGILPASDPHAVALRRLERAVSVIREPDSPVVNVNVTTPDRDTSARVANAVMKAYVADVTPTQSQAAPSAFRPADTSLEALQTRLQDAERNYQNYRRDSAIAGTNAAIEKQIDELTSQIGAAEAKVKSLRATLAQVQNARDDRDFDAIPAALRSKTFDALKSRYSLARRIESDLSETLGPRHPDMKFAKQQTADARHMLDRAIGDMVQSFSTELERARSFAAKLKVRLEALNKDLGKSGEAAARLNELETEVEASRAAYQEFLLQSRNVGEQPPIANNTTPRILTRAVPPAERAGPSPVRILFLSFLLGLGLAVSLAWLLELTGERRATLLPD